MILNTKKYFIYIYAVFNRKNQLMDRRKFIKTGGIAATGIVIGCCSGCTKMENPTPPITPTEGIDFTLDLTDPLMSNLQNPGANLIVDEEGNITETGLFVIALSQEGEYIAATRICSHQDKPKIEYMQSLNAWVCTEHLAAFKLTGNGDDTIFPNADPTVNNNGLTVYNTELIDSSTLRIFS